MGEGGGGGGGGACTKKNSIFFTLHQDAKASSTGLSENPYSSRNQHPRAERSLDHIGYMVTVT